MYLRFLMFDQNQNAERLQRCGILSFRRSMSTYFGPIVFIKGSSSGLRPRPGQRNNRVYFSIVLPTHPTHRVEGDRRRQMRLADLPSPLRAKMEAPRSESHEGLTQPTLVGPAGIKVVLEMCQSLADPEPPAYSALPGISMRSTDELEDFEMIREWVGAWQQETLRTRGTAG